MSLTKRFKRLIGRAAGTLAFALLALPLHVAATQVVQTSFVETLRQSDGVVLGRVLSKQSRWGDGTKRWIVTDVELEVSEVVVSPVTEAPPVARLKLAWWGGTVDDETQQVADLTQPEVGDRVLLMLRPLPERTTTGFTPVVAMNHGLFFVDDRQGAAIQVLDANRRSLALMSTGAIMRREMAGATATAPAADLATVLAWIRQNVVRIRAAPGERVSQLGRDHPDVLNTFSLVPERVDRRFPMPPTGPTSSPAVVASVPAAPSPMPHAPPDGSSAQAVSVSRETSLDQPAYTWSRRPPAPIVVNQFPPSFAPWSPEDQYQMSKWNYYAFEVFRVFVTPTGTFGWPNDRFDLAGWPSSADLSRVYGRGWDASTIGITFFRWIGSGPIVEADIALNPAFSFTLNDELVYGGASVQGFRQVMLHELGHMWGLAHNFNAMSTMNYMPSPFRAFGLPYMDDAEATRSAYSGIAVPRNDLAIYLYNADCGYQCISEAVFDKTVVRGRSLTVNNYHVENVGTTTIATPTIEWYLTPVQSFFSGYVSLGTTVYPSLARFSYFFPNSVSRALAVPASVTPGDYFLAAYIRNDEGAGQSGFPFGNNYAFSRTKVRVQSGSTTTLTLSPNPSLVGQPVTITASVSGSAPTGTVVFRDGGVPMASCGTRALSSGSASCVTSALSAGSHSLTADYSGDSWNAPSTSPAKIQVVNAPPPTGCAITIIAPTGGVLPSAGGAVSLAAACAGGGAVTSWSWRRNGAAIGGNSAGLADTLPANSLATPLSYNYDLVACSGIMCAAPVATTVTVAAAPPPSPSGCSISVLNPASGQLPQVGGSVSLAAECSAGGAVTSWSWRKNGAAIGGNTASFAETLPANTTTTILAHLYEAIACNGASCAAPAWKIITIAPMLPSVASGQRRRDLNGDGRADLLWRSAAGETKVWLMAGLGFSTDALLLSPGQTSVTHHAFLDADRNADLLTFDAATGTTSAWLMNGATPLSTVPLLADPFGGWKVAFVGDFNGDNQSDLLWRNAFTNAHAIWLMKDSMPTSVAGLPVPATWDVTHVTDLDGDGRTDVLWRNAATGETAAWLMNGTTMSGGAVVLANAAWRVVLTGDFDGDGRGDLLWRNATTGETAVWLMNGLSLTAGAIVLANAAWVPTHVADFNADGRTDLVWRNATSGETAVWLMNGLSFAGGAGLLKSLDWSVTLTGDFDGDGKTDLVWRNAATGEAALWLMDGKSIKAGVNPFGLAGYVAH